MDFSITKRLDVDNDEGDYLEFENDDFAMIWFKNGHCETVQIQEIQEYGFVVRDENDEESFVNYLQLQNIQRI